MYVQNVRIQMYLATSNQQGLAKTRKSQDPVSPFVCVWSIQIAQPARWLCSQERLRVEMMLKGRFKDEIIYESSIRNDSRKTTIQILLPIGTNLNLFDFGLA